MIKALLELTYTPVVDMKYTVARQFLGDTAPPDGGKWTMGRVLKHLHQPIEAMSSVLMR